MSTTSDPATTPADRRATTVAVLGQGPMGRALTCILHAAGVPLTLWNRTAARAEQTLAGLSGPAPARVVTDPAEAAAGAQLLLVNLVDHDAADEVLRRIGPLRDRTVITASSDTPERKRATAKLVTQAGGRHLDAAIMTPVETIGTPDASVLYAGAQELFEKHQDLLELLGTAHWSGSEPGRAAGFDMALLDLFWTTLAAWSHAAALARAEGIAPAELLPHALGIREILGPIFIDMAERWRDDRHDDATSAVTSIVTSVGHIRSAAASRGLDTAALDALHRQLGMLVDAGHGDEGSSRLIDIVASSR